jgi:hypothetical protein
MGLLKLHPVSCLEIPTCATPTRPLVPS